MGREGERYQPINNYYTYMMYSVTYYCDVHDTHFVIIPPLPPSPPLLHTVAQ